MLLTSLALLAAATRRVKGVRTLPSRTNLMSATLV
jgi:hypothetical protein